MSAARRLIADAARVGAAFKLDGARLRLVPSPGCALPADLVERAKAARADLVALLSAPTADPANWQERAAHLEFDAGLPREWAEHFGRLLHAPAPGDFTPTRWQAVIDGALRFADRWAVEAHRQGWGAQEVFGLDEVAPAARVDRSGLAWLLGDGSQVVALDRNGADIMTRSGSRQRFYRRRTIH